MRAAFKSSSLPSAAICAAACAAAVAVALIAAACASPVVPNAGPPQTTAASTTTTEPGLPGLPTQTTIAPSPSTTLPPGEPPPDPPAMDEIPGLTDETIRIAVIGDIETGGLADNRSRSAWMAMEAWASAIEAFGGLAGRSVNLTFIDTGLSNHQRAINQVCDGDFFAIVGSDALFDDEGIDRLGGTECPVLDFPAVAHTPRRQNRAESFVSNPQPPGQLQIGPANRLLESSAQAADAIALPILDLTPLDISSEKMFEALSAAGYGATITVNDDIMLFNLLCFPQQFYNELAGLDITSLIWTAYGPWLTELLASRGVDAGATGEPDEPGEPSEPGEPDDPIDSNTPDSPSDPTTSADGQPEEPGASSDPDSSEQAQSGADQDENDGTAPTEDPDSDTTGSGTGTGVGTGTGASDNDPDAETTTPTRDFCTLLEPDVPADAADADPTDTDAAQAPQQLEPEFTLCDHSCYGTQATDFLTAADAADDAADPNLKVWTHLYPIEEAAANPELALYVLLSRTSSNTPDDQQVAPDLQGLAAWSAGRLFEEAVNIAVEELNRPTTPDISPPGSSSDSTANAAPLLTQQAVLDAVASITDWTARGLHAPTNPAEKIPTPCYVLLAWNAQQASWQREHPAAPGEWDCSEDNLYALRWTAEFGLLGG